MNTAVLLTGSNQGNRQERLLACNDLITTHIGQIVELSPIYQTAAWGKEDLPPHLNQALIVNTPHTPVELLAQIHAIEKSLGRIRQEKWGVRTIDIDIIYFNNEHIQLPTLTIPHPYMQLRRFVLVPLCAIQPQFIHPVLQLSNGQLLQQCTDALDVELFSSGPFL